MVTGLVASLRPRQWVKNLFLFAGLVFGQKLFTPAVWTAGAAFLIFCGLSGAVYLLNDVADRERDRLHPDKRHRPVAAGHLSVPAAVTAAIVLIVAGLAASVWLSRGFAAGGPQLRGPADRLLGLAQAPRHRGCPGRGDRLRAARGGRSAGGQVAISGWLLICTFLIALFLALGKRRHEVLTLEGAAPAAPRDPGRVLRRPCSIR